MDGDHCFGAVFGNVTLAHLACALGSTDIVQVLLNQTGSENGIWISKDDEGIYISGVCVCVCEGEGGRREGGVGGWSEFVSMCGAGRREEL